MKNILIFSLQLIGFNFCVYAQNDFKPQRFTVLGTSNGMKLLKQCSRSSPDSVSGFWVVTQFDINLLENNFKKILALEAVKCCMTGSKIVSLKTYCFQYTGVIINNKKYIYINAFYIDGDALDTYLNKWKTEPVIICDGGIGEWGALFDIQEKSFSQLCINGIG
jgi:hypothetical protein